MKMKEKENILFRYLELDEATKEICRDAVFSSYYKNSGKDIRITIERIEEDLKMLEQKERYERCALLKDILKEFD